jgi:hypothetical protein
MVKRKGDQGAAGWSEMRPHDEFLELCAVSTSGDLTEGEWKKLQDHLVGCAECRLALKEFEVVADVGVPLLSSELFPTLSEHANTVPTEIVVATAARGASIETKASRALPVAALISARRNGRRHTQVNWSYGWVSLAAGVVLTVALGIYSYEIGNRRGLEIVRVTPSSTDTRVGALEQQMSDAGHEREVLKAQLVERDKVIADLRRQIEQQSASLDEMKSAQARLEQSLQRDEAQKQQVAQERGSLAQKLDAAQVSLEKIQAELESVRQQRSQDQLLAASFETEIKDLSSQLRERDETIGRQEELLAHDRDIRDLMGARDLYIAEVYDVARDGVTQKPYGRVFYTKGKSLVFYAYDLNQQAGVKNASTFQAWVGAAPTESRR